MSKLAASLATAAVLVLSGTGAADASVRTEAAGNYVYVCVLTTGYSYTIQHGQKLSTCKGSHLLQYLYGTRTLSIPLDGSGKRANPKRVDGDCIIALVGNSMLFFVPVVNGFEVAATVSGLYGLKSCLA
jgi:opacity protein-like surface antigen